MHVEVNGTRLWFDVDGPALVPDGPEMRERPTVVLLHGGPGSFDHSYFKPHDGHEPEQLQAAVAASPASASFAIGRGPAQGLSRS